MELPWSNVPLVDRSAFADVRRRAIFECCKWDPQVEDTATLSDVAIVLRAEAWNALATLAERLEAETLAAERELLDRPELHRALALPRAIRTALRGTCHRDSVSVLRVSRYDFHFARDGWRISEVNSDVPGGFIEASGFARLVAGAIGKVAVVGDPAGTLARELAFRVDRAPTRQRAIHTLTPARGKGSLPLVALVHATAYNDDRQVMAYLAQRFADVGLRTELVAPDHLQWRDGTAMLDDQPLAAIIRFFPGEWLPNLPRRSGWRHLMGGSRTPVINPAAALLTQSKRFPLVWPALACELPTWRALLPHTRPVRWREHVHDARVIYKPALGRVGDGVGIAAVTNAREWKRIRRSLRFHRRHWIAQDRFEAVPVHTPRGWFYPAFGVFVIGGRACGIYGRMAARPLIDYKAMDVAVLVAQPAHRGVRSSQGTPAHEAARVV